MTVWSAPMPCLLVGWVPLLEVLGALRRGLERREDVVPPRVAHRPHRVERERVTVGDAREEELSQRRLKRWWVLWAVEAVDGVDGGRVDG